MSTSRSSDVQNLADSQTQLMPSRSMPELNPNALEYFGYYSQGKALNDWFEHEVIMLGQLSKISVLIDNLIYAIEKEGSVVIGVTGRNIPHPGLAALAKLAALELNFVRALRLAVKPGREKVTKRSDMTKHAQKQRNSRVVNFQKENLLAAPD